MEKVRQNDPKLGAVVAVISQWAEVIGYDVRVTTKELIDHAIREEFITPSHRELIVVESEPIRLLDRLATHEMPIVRRWLKRDEI